MTAAHDLVALLDWRRRIVDLYAEVRAEADPARGWRRWREGRDELFRSHPQSPLPKEGREDFAGIAYFDYDPAWRARAEVEPAEPDRIELPGSAGARFTGTRFARARFRIDGREAALGLFWLEGYAGGLFVSFRDATSGKETYGACRYLLDTVKGADLGGERGRVVLDFNFAYNPSCSYDPGWACPLAPPENLVAFEVRAGERTG